MPNRFAVGKSKPRDYHLLEQTVRRRAGSRWMDGIVKRLLSTSEYLGRWLLLVHPEFSVDLFAVQAVMEIHQVHRR